MCARAQALLHTEVHLYPQQQQDDLPHYHNDRAQQGVRKEGNVKKNGNVPQAPSHHDAAEDSKRRRKKGMMPGEGLAHFLRKARPQISNQI